MIKESLWLPNNRVWRPGEQWSLDGYSAPDSNFELSINDPRIAESLLEIEPSKESVNSLNRMGRKFAAKYGYISPKPFIFYKDSILLQEICLGKNRPWLAMSGNTSYYLSMLPYKEEKIIYAAQNVRNSTDKGTLVALFKIWDRRVSRLKEKLVFQL